MSRSASSCADTTSCVCTRFCPHAATAITNVVEKFAFVNDARCCVNTTVSLESAAAKVNACKKKDIEHGSAGQTVPFSQPTRDVHSCAVPFPFFEITEIVRSVGQSHHTRSGELSIGKASDLPVLARCRVNECVGRRLQYFPLAVGVLPRLVALLPARALLLVRSVPVQGMR